MLSLLYIEVWKSPKRHLYPDWLAGTKWKGTKTRDLFTNLTKNRVTMGYGIHHSQPVVSAVHNIWPAQQGLAATGRPWGPPRPWWGPWSARGNGWAPLRFSLLEKPWPQQIFLQDYKAFKNGGQRDVPGTQYEFSRNCHMTTVIVLLCSISSRKGTPTFL